MGRAFEIFLGLCQDLPATELAALKGMVRAHYESLLETQRKNELIAVDLAQALCERLETLLAMAHLLDPGARSQIVGAARYFVSTDDEKPDDDSCTGLDDDVKVFNHVVRRLGRPDLVITD